MAAHRGRANRSGMSPVQYRTATGTARARQASGEAETAVGDDGRAGREGACTGRAEGVRGAHGAPCCWAHAPATRARGGCPERGRGGRRGRAGRAPPEPPPPGGVPLRHPPHLFFRAPLGRPSHPSGRHKSPASTATTVNTRPPLLPLEGTRRSSYTSAEGPVDPQLGRNPPSSHPPPSPLHRAAASRLPRGTAGGASERWPIGRAHCQGSGPPWLGDGPSRVTPRSNGLPARSMKHPPWPCSARPAPLQPTDA